MKGGLRSGACGVGEGGCPGKHCSQLAGEQLCSLGHKEYSMVAHPSSSPLPNTGALSLLWVQLFSQVPSVVAFHSPALSILLPPPVTHHFLVPQAISTPPTPACSWALTSRAKVLVPSSHLSVSVFGDCASGSEDLFSSRSAFQISDLLLHSSEHLEIPPTQLILLSIRWLSRVWVPFLLYTSLSGVPVVLIPLLSLSSFLSFYPVMSQDSCCYWRFKFFCQHLVAVLC